MTLKWRRSEFITIAFPNGKLEACFELRKLLLHGDHECWVLLEVCLKIGLVLPGR